MIYFTTTVFFAVAVVLVAVSTTDVSGFMSPSSVSCSRYQQPYSKATTAAATTLITSHSLLLLRASTSDNTDDNSDENDDEPTTPTFLSSRRDTFTRTVAATTAAVLTATATVVPFSLPEPAMAAAADVATTLQTKQEILAKLAGIPTFALVNEEGIPFVIFDRSTGSGTGYFFLTKDFALQALESARKSDPAQGADEIWSKAQIKVVPMSIALQLALGKRRRTTINKEQGVEGIQVDTIHLLIPSDVGNRDAARLDTQRDNNAKKWEQKGRVPLFHIQEKSVAANGKLGRSYYSFETKDLINDYKIRNNDPSLLDFPPIQIDQLIYNVNKVTTSVQGKKGDWSELSDFASSIQPTKEARQDAIEFLTKEQQSPGGITQYNLDKAYLVGAATR